jgi:hypothetical protein
LWKLYPRKKGKGSVSDRQKKRLYDIGADQMTRAIERFKADNAGQEEKFIPYGSTFFNSAYVDYLDENYCHTPADEEAETSKSTSAWGGKWE